MCSFILKEHGVQFIVTIFQSMYLEGRIFKMCLFSRNVPGVHCISLTRVHAAENFDQDTEHLEKLISRGNKGPRRKGFVHGDENSTWRE